jgi:hypothetical protein
MNEGSLFLSVQSQDRKHICQKSQCLAHKIGRLGDGSSCSVGPKSVFAILRRAHYCSLMSAIILNLPLFSDQMVIGQSVPNNDAKVYGQYM